MIKSVVREHHWAPHIVGALYFDAEDYQGLQFWYDDLAEMQKEIKDRSKEKS